MKYRYLNTGVIVESDHVLDSALFTPVVTIPSKSAEHTQTDDKMSRKAGKNDDTRNNR